jgi:fibronectin-binding autotransporter adhesin
MHLCPIDRTRLQVRRRFPVLMQWLAMIVLLLYGFLAIEPAMAAPHATANPAPLAQGTTVERWVDGTLGSDTIENDEEELVANNCTRQVVPPEDEEDEEEYVYHSCATIAHALAIANPGDVIRVARKAEILNPLVVIAYSENLIITKKVTIVGGYAPGFGAQIEPPRDPIQNPTVIHGTIEIRGATAAIYPQGFPSEFIDPEPPMEIRLEGLHVAWGNGISIQSAAVSLNAFLYRPANRVNVELQSMVVRNHSSSGIYITGNSNKLTASKSRIHNNSATTGGGIYATGSSLVNLGEGTIIHDNIATNGAGLAASGALTITIDGGVTITTNTATSGGGGIHASGSRLNVGSDTAILANSAPYGGGVYLAGGSNILSGAIIGGNSATTEGGGIYVTGGAPTLENLKVTQNSAGSGGGLFLTNLSGGSLNGSDILTNTATTGGGYTIKANVGAFSASSLLVQANKASQDGGGAYVSSSTNTTIKGHTFNANHADFDENNNGNGGGLYLKSSAVALDGNTYTLNSAYDGGALYIDASDSTTLRGDSVTNNSARRNGGGVYLSGNNGTKLIGLELITNQAAGQGGGLYTTATPNTSIGAPQVQGNTSGGAGAGLYAINSTLTFTGSALLQDNIAGTEGGGGYLGSGALLTFENFDMQGNEATQGGGFYADGGRFTATGAISFLSNKATNGAGGALYLQGNGSTTTAMQEIFARGNEAPNGGAFYGESVILHLGTVNLTGNKANGGNGGAAYFINSQVTFTGAANLTDNIAGSNGGGIYASATPITFNSTAQFMGNHAQGGSGGGVYLTADSGFTANFGVAAFFENVASQHGGGIYAETVSVVVSPTTRFESNSAQGGDGGGLYITGSSLSLSKVTLKSNRAFASGGGGYLSEGNLSLLNDTLIDDNSATASGGGLATNKASNVLVDDTIFTNNRASNDGGALHLTNSALAVQNGVSFTSNSVTAGRGGAIYVSGGSANVTSATFSKNKAGNSGGALHVTADTFTLLNSTLSENEAGTGPGGGAYLKANSATLTSSNIEKNLAASGAGLVISETASANLNSLNIIENYSSGPGGALYLGSSILGSSIIDANRLTLRGNQASSEGGGIYARFSTVKIANTLVVDNRITTLDNYAAGIYVGNSQFSATHSTIANNSHQQLQGSAHGFYVAVSVAAPSGFPTQSSITLTNSIVSGQSVGLNLLAGNTANLNAVLWNNAHFEWTGAGTFSVTNSRRGDPRFVSVATHDYHLRRDSATFDQGGVTDLAVDLEGVTRAQGLAPDLGAYEHRYNAGLYLTTSISPAFVRVGDNVTIRLRVRNQSSSTANGVVLRATLPSQLPLPAISSGSCQGIFCEVNLGSLAAGADITMEINVGVGGTASVNGLLNLLTNVTLATSNFTSSDTTATALTYLYSCRAELNGSVYGTVQAALNQASDGQTIRISGACGDLHQNGGPGQLLTLNKNVTLQGGWDSTFTTLNPSAFPTYLDSAGLGRVIYINGGFTPTLENLILRNGNASKLGGGPAGKDAGGGLYINGGAPILRNVEIVNNHSPDLGGGVYLATPTVVHFEGGFVRNNSAGERGGGLYIDQSAPVLTGVTIAGNSARGGGGVYLYRSPAQFIDNAATGAAPTCRIETNTTSVMPNYIAGPGAGRLPVLWLAPGGGGGLVLDESAALIRGCAINNNVGRVGGGIYIHNSAATLENSLVTANVAQQPYPNAILIGPGGVRDGDGGGLVLDNLDPTMIVLRGLLLGSNQALRGSGLLARLARSGTLALSHFTINSNSGGSAVFALGESRLALNDTIVAFNTGGAALFAQTGSNSETATITLDRTLWHPPTQTKTSSSGGASVTSTTEFSGDPAFRDDGYHLKRISFAYGMGATSASFADRDGHMRPIGANVELGADEYATAVTVRYVAADGTGSAPCTDYRTPCASLQTAIDASSAGDLIKMAGGSYSAVRNDGGRIHFARIDKAVTIQGGYFPRTNNNNVTDKLYTVNDWEDPHPAENPTIIDVANQGRIFYISSNITPTLAYLTLRRGNALAQADGPAGSVGGGGGAVYVDGATPIFQNVIVEDSRADFGSGFYLRNASGIYTGLTVRQNGSDVTLGRGGGFYIEGGQPTLQGVTIQSNVAITGAGIYLDNSAATLLQNNIAGNGNVTTLNGGGIYSSGGSATIITNTVATNRAQSGGGLRLDNSSGILAGNIIDNNRAGTDPAPVGQSDGLGGGLYIAGGTPRIVANTIRNNQALHPTLSLGGGIYIAQSEATLTGNTIATNQAHRGGGLYFAATIDTVVQNNTITSNRAQAGDGSVRQAGGGVYFASSVISFTQNSLGQNIAAYGAGLYVAGIGQNQIVQNTLTSNAASQDGGGLYLDGSDAHLTANTLQDNRTTGGRGGGLYARNGQAALRQNSFIANFATLDGGGLYLSQDGSTLQGDIIQGNQAGDGGGLYIDGPAPGASQPAPWINQVLLAENRANNHGGGLFIRTSYAQITFNTLRDNQAAVDGGGAVIQESIPAAFSGNIIRDNQAGDQGGGLYIGRRSAGSYHSNAIIDNQAGQGGGIFVAGASPTFVHTTLARNGTGLLTGVLDQVAATVVLSNTILAGHTLGIQAASGTSVATYATLWDGNSANLVGPGSVTSSADHSGSAAFDSDGYHLTNASAAASKGLRGDVALGSDLDDESRFQGNGPELGADELTAGCSVILAGSPGNVFSNLQQAIDAASPDSEVLVAGTCTGVEARDGTPQLAYTNKNLTIRGGYAVGVWDVSSPTTQPSVLDARQQGRGVRIVGGARVTLANLTLVNGNAIGLGGGPSGVDAGGNLYVDNAQVNLEQVDVVNGRALIGGGLFLRAPVALVRNSTFRANLAATSGGALYLDNAPSSVEIRNSRFISNRAGDGAALHVATGTPLLLGNHFQGNQTNSSSGRGGAVFLENSFASLNRNRMENNRAGMGGALYIMGGMPSLTNNLLVGNVGMSSGGALYSIDSPLHLRNNTLVSNSTVILDGAALRFAAPISSQVLTLTNNILVNHSLAVSVAEGNQMSVRANLWNNNQTNWAGPVSEGIGNLSQEPLFVNAAVGNYRLNESSPAVDRGVNVGVNDDIDGQNRPARQGFDIGADEYLRPSVNVSLNALPNPVASGSQQNYVLQVINNGDVDVVARVQVTLPVALSAVGPTVWESVAIARGAIWSQNVAATVDANYSGPINALMVVTTNLGATASATTSSSAAAISGEILEFSGESTPNPASPGSAIELRLRIANRGAIPLGTTIQVQLPDGLTTSSPLLYNPTIAGPDGLWSTRLNVNVAPDVASETSAGAANELVTTILATTDQGFSKVYSLTTTLARPAVQVSRTASPTPTIAGGALIYNVIVTNTGNVALAATISNSFPAQVALANLADGAPWQGMLTPGQVWQHSVTSTIETGYAGSLAGSVQVTTDAGVGATAQDQINAQLPSLTPSATAKGGDWYNPASWEPLGVPGSDVIIVIPENIAMYSNRPVSIFGLINRGSLELRNPLGTSQALTLTYILENYGEIWGKDATGAGQAGLTLNLAPAILYNEGTICAGDGAPNGGAGGDLIIIAGATTNIGIFCAGRGADVHDASANLPGGPGGEVLLSFDPGLFTNRGQVLAGDGGNSHPDAVPPQPGGNGGHVTIVATAAARLNNSDVRAGAGGQGSSGSMQGITGQVVVGAPAIDTQETHFSDGTVLIIRQDGTFYNFAAVGPDNVSLSPASGLALFNIRVFNRGARQDTYVVTPLSTPTGWQVNNLPATLNLGAFHSSLLTVLLSVPLDQPAGMADQPFSIVVTSQQDASNQIVIPLEVVLTDELYRLQLPKINR